MRSAWLLVMVLMSGCLRDNLVDCGNGVACPAGTACATASFNGTDKTFCVDPVALDACEEVEGLGACLLDGGIPGTCHGGACLPNMCGNLLVDTNEVCDDGNTRTGDGCSSTCESDETCGNGVIDPLAVVNDVVVPNEQCDDGGLLSHDGCSSRCQSEVLRWESIFTSMPDGKHSHAFAYDSARDRIVLFGGAATGNFAIPLPRGDTWESDGVGWSRVTTRISPPARYGHVMAYDPDRHRTILFGGGASGTLFNDTWEWDGTSWLRLSPPTSPSPRRNAAATFDPVRGRLILVGGEDGGSVLGDIWEWDGTTWTERSFAVAPPPRMLAHMAFDPVRGVAVLVGGSNVATDFADTWEYDGTSWTASPALLPLAGTLNGLAFDGTAMIAFDDQPPPVVATNTLRYTGTTWTRPLANGSVEPPTRRTSSAMVYDPRRSRIVLFGGFFSDPLCPGGCPASLADLWVWDRTQWTERTVAAPTERTHHASAYDLDRGCAVVFGGGTSIATAMTPAETWELCGDHWSSRPGTQPIARVLGAMAYDAIRRRTVLFGGRNPSSAPIGQTTLWDGTSWTAFVGSEPPARAGHAMAFDPARGNIVMFGGQTGAGSFRDDTWVWNGTGWVEVLPPLRPRPRSGHRLTYDLNRQTLVLLGGEDATGIFADHWEWDGVTWTDRSSPLLSPARSGYAVAWNAPRAEMVQYGGAAGFSFFDDVWESLNGTWTQQFASGGVFARYGHSLTPAHDGLLMFGGYTIASTPVNELWRLRWDDDAVNEACTLQADLDGDGRVGCDDPDCWYVCSPQCPPGVPCAATAPRCGDGACNSAIETCRMCPGDCGACNAVCGDNFCDSPENSQLCAGDCS